ncbi:hypothetical protein Tco_0399139, partial [Tanacetum coccineum]
YGRETEGLVFGTGATTGATVGSRTGVVIGSGPTGGTDISQKDEKPIKKRQNRTRDGKVCEDEAKSK